MYKYILILSSVILMSCQFHHKDNIVLPDVQKVKFDRLEINYQIFGVSSMFVANNMLVIAEPSRDKVFSFWTLPDCKYLYSAGEIGHSGNELLRFDKTQKITDNGFKIFELETKYIKEIKIKENGEFNITNIYKLPIGSENVNRIIFLESNKYAFIPENDDTEFCRVDENGKRENFGVYPTDLLLLEGMPRMFTYNKLVAAKPDGSKFVSFYTYMKRFRIFDSCGKMLNDVVVGDIDPNAAQQRKKFYIKPPVTSDKYIYALANEQDGTQILEIWDWNGSIIKRYNISESFASFTVDKDIIYAISADYQYIYKCKIDYT